MTMTPLSLASKTPQTNTNANAPFMLIPTKIKPCLTYTYTSPLVFVSALPLSAHLARHFPFLYLLRIRMLGGLEAQQQLAALQLLAGQLPQVVVGAEVGTLAAAAW
jgi:hypothetical protein